MILFSPIKSFFLKFALVLFFTVFTVSVASSAVASTTVGRSDADFEGWLDRQKVISVKRMMKNISPPGTKLGTVVASPSRNDPDYYFHWIRDASLTINAVVGLAERSAGAEQAIYLSAIANFVSLSVDEQQRANLGEPRFNVDGSVDTIPWSRPQHDGPALRVIVLIRFLKSFPDSKLSAEIFEVIRRDLDFIEKIWTGYTPNCRSGQKGNCKKGIGVYLLFIIAYLLFWGISLLLRIAILALLFIF